MMVRTLENNYFLMRTKLGYLRYYPQNALDSGFFEEWLIGLSCYVRIARLNLGTQPRYEDPEDFCVENHIKRSD